VERQRVSSKSLSTNESKHSTKNPLLRFALKRFFASVNAMIPGVKTVFDAGCGEGYGAQAILKQHSDIRIIGVDRSLEALHQVPAQIPAMPVAQADVTRLPIASKSADIVLSFEVMEHLPDPAGALAEYQRVSRRYVMVSVPNEPLFRLLRMLRGDDLRHWGNHPEHINHWNLWSLQRYLRQHGLRVIRASSPPPFIWAIVLCEITAEIRSDSPRRTNTA
jgi:SAM-dependent methyltransferase